MTSLEEHVADRDRWARGPRGPLALVTAQAVEQPQPVWPVPGRWAPAPGGLSVTAEATDGVVVDGVPVDGTELVAGDTAVVPSLVAFPGGLAGSVHGTTLRVWDPASDAVARFDHIARFPADPTHVTTGRYTPVDGLEARGSVRDAAGDPLLVAGTVSAVIGGVAAHLLAVQAAVHRGTPRLQLIVQDATSALPEDDPGSSYSMGRFLFLDDPGTEAEVALDWDRLVLPPCAFSYQYACPIPPEQNRLTVPIRAGERHPVDASGAVLH
ncbi:DUF1684 domain-containing protein [Curtobacterium sp. MCBA15_004]|uniref:DUF1684 domain-containing protein n=1 Tax=unclassified Curtobacterium TaxID=257496 RepID=UPI0008DD7DE6|nr:DUF1684 domain-containing protein [Curtobacterium sp. MCBA15_004]WIA98188.1 DUF1684 domain-containing protein [Curtobacterium sp. MCBA15_004]